MTNGENREHSGNVETFRAPEGTPIGIFQEKMAQWHEKYANLIETGADERFERLRDGLTQDLMAYGKKVSPVALDYMARTFDVKRSEWAKKAEEVEMEDQQEAYANVSLRYASLSSIINRIQAMP